MPDYYSILGVSRSASKEEIKKAYRRLAMKWHPDHNASPDAKQKFIQINDAYERLTEGRPRYVYKSVVTKKPTHSRPKTAREMDEERMEKSRERVRRHNEEVREQFANLRKRLKFAPDANEQKRKMLLSAYTDLSLLWIVLAVAILVGIISENVPIAMLIGALGLRATIPYFVSGRKKTEKIRMIFGAKENYTIQELEENVFYREN